MPGRSGDGRPAARRAAGAAPLRSGRARASLLGVLLGLGAAFHPACSGGEPARPGAGRYPHALALADIDRDGRLDIIVAASAGRQVVVLM
ncbi:MAG: VCBS repeat-containing protein, partial [Candidatus Tectomicrobia bacterium]|nr:VCBS repeat-containing protein [Candidatus Tectomicrobia bacterium]